MKAITVQYRFGPIVYLVGFVAAFFSAALSVGNNIALAIFFAIPPRQAILAQRGTS